MALVAASRNIIVQPWAHDDFTAYTDSVCVFSTMPSGNKKTNVMATTKQNQYRHYLLAKRDSILFYPT